MDSAQDFDPSGRRRPARPAPYALTGSGLKFPGAGHPYRNPLFFRDHVIAPVRTIGTQSRASFKLSYWQSTVEDSPQASESSFVTASLRTSEATAWRDRSRSGLISMLPFEGAHWRFEQPVSFVQFHLPFELMDMVCGALFEKELSHDHLRMPADVEDARLLTRLEAIRHVAAAVEPTNLLLDSWALILAELLLLRLSSHAEFRGRASVERLPGRNLARVVDYIDAAIDQDLRLEVLAEIAGMSMYSFARCFKATLGVSPHAYVIARRIARSRTMLARGDGDLVQVALACGFSSQSHFTTAFRRGLGVTPGAYRRRIQ